MIPPWVYLDEHDRATFRAAVAFLDTRLAEQGTIDWALRLKPGQHIERTAVIDLLNSPRSQALKEPWATAWRLIEESWSASAIEEGPSTAIYGIQARLLAGDHSGAIVSAIVNLVAPRLKVKSIDSGRWQFVKKPRRPKTYDDLLSAGLSSGDLVDLNVLKLGNISDVLFLKALANALEAAINHGLDIARRIGWDGKTQLWRLGFLNRVNYTQYSLRVKRKNEPDAFHRGIAPSVKLLHAVVSRIADLQAKAAWPFVQHWQLAGSPIHIRLWAAIARNPQLVPAEEVGAFLLGLDDSQFWDLRLFPEIAELRSLRFSELDLEQKAILTRIRKGPPRGHWSKNAETAKVKEARLYWAVRELRRIEVAGGELPPGAGSWLKVRIEQFPDLAEMSIDDGFSKGVETRSVPRNPDARYDTLIGVDRLRELEASLSANRGGWDDDPAERANDWLMQPEKAALVLSDLETVGNGGSDFPRIWDRFAWAHSQPRPAETPQRNLQEEVGRVLALLELLSENTLSSAIEGVSHWLYAWKTQIVASPGGLRIWLRVWPIAVEETNARQEKEDDADLKVTATASDTEGKPVELDTLNPPAAKLVDVFLSACPSLAQTGAPFAAGSPARIMRDAVIADTGRSGLIARHLLIEKLPYFLRADHDWTQEHLITPLLNDDGTSLALWGAIARRTHFTEVLKIIGDAMAERATDRRLGREIRQMLVFSLVVESLHAFRDKREPAVPNPRIQQMLRTLDDEVRASAANAVQQFVRDLSTKQPEDQNAPSAADLFRSAAAPFLRDVWPQERSLATPGVSGAFADLPATAGDAIAEAVNAIERFLVPFECWSMIDYGLYGDDNGEKKLAIVNDSSKASAFLHLLDLTVGSSEGAVVPLDLTDALDQIRSVAPVLADSPAFRRLSTAARR